MQERGTGSIDQLPTDESASNEYPFNELQEKRDIVEGAFSTIHELQNNPNWVIKEMSQVLDNSYETHLMLQRRNRAGEPPKMTIERFESEVARHREIIMNNESNVKQLIPENYLIYGKGEGGHERGFIVMRKVIGTEITELEKVTEEQIQLIEQTLIESFKFFDNSSHTSPSGKVVRYFPDLIQTPEQEDDSYKLHNIIIGHQSYDNKKQNDQAYIIDNYPLRTIWEDRAPTFFYKLKEAINDFESTHQSTFSEELHQILQNHTSEAA